MLETRSQLHCWIAPRNILPGQEYGEAIVSGIAASAYVVLLLSEEANESPQVEREIERAAAKHVDIIPLRIQDVQPSPRLEYFISSCQWVDGFASPIKDVAEALADTLEREEPLPVPPPPRPRGRTPQYVVAAAALLVLLPLAIYVMRHRPLTYGAPADTAAVVQQGAARTATPEPAPKIEGVWKADVKYDWGDRYTETFRFTMDGDEVLGTASFLEAGRGILDGKLSGNKLTFNTKTQTALNDSAPKEEVHHYRGIVSREQIRFYMQTEGGYSDHTPIEFEALRAEAYAALVRTPEPDRGRAVNCDKSEPAHFRQIDELGRIEAVDELNNTLYEFVVCEEKDTAKGAFTVKISSNWLSGTWVDSAEAPRLAKEMQKKQQDCRPRGGPYNPLGDGDKRRITYNFCQKQGKPDSVEVRVTTLRADASPNSEKVLTVKWPQ